MPDEVKPEEPPVVWAIVSLLGHKQYAGKLSEVERFGGKLGRIDVIDDKQASGFRTVEFGSGSVYGIEYVSEEAARCAARRTMPKPVESWELPKQLAAAPEPIEDILDDDSEEVPFGHSENDRY
jgi:hypothetical protein